MNARKKGPKITVLKQVMDFSGNNIYYICTTVRFYLMFGIVFKDHKCSLVCQSGSTQPGFTPILITAIIFLLCI